MKIKNRLSAAFRRTLYLILFCQLAALPSLVVAAEQSSSSESLPPADTPEATSRDISLPAGAQFSERILGLHGLKNVGRIAPEVYCGDCATGTKLADFLSINRITKSGPYLHDCKITNVFGLLFLHNINTAGFRREKIPTSIEQDVAFIT
jgi:hypothetical protein